MAFCSPLLPIFVFVTVAAIARLIVKGARENAYLLKNLGWSRSFRIALRSLVLWLPMAVFAAPYLYSAEIALPKGTINNLYKNGLENRLMEAFDEIVPAKLKFDEYYSDAVVIGGAIKTGVEAGQA